MNSAPLTHSYLDALEITPALQEVIGAFHVIETHLSVVAVGLRYTIKFKKKVRFPFVDYTLLPSRIEGARAELDLNRRLSHGVYRGLAVIRAGGAIELTESIASLQEGAIEVGVWMETLPSEAFLSLQLERSQISEREIAAIADRIAVFHRALPPTPHLTHHRYLRALHDHTSENLETIRAHLPKPAFPGMGEAYTRLAEWCRITLSTVAPLLEARFAQGWVREGHGDLRADHLVLFRGGVHAIDCIEFAPEYRALDLLDEITFLEMDLCSQGYPDLALRVLTSYLRVSDTPWHEDLHTFFFVYRACVRAKVALLAPPPVNPPPPGHRPQWERLFGLATGATFRSPTSGAKLIIVSGLTGTGKSTIARAFALHLGAEVIQSDAIRRRLFGEPAPSTDRDSRYTPTRKEKVYEVALTEAAGILARGGWVVLDATFSTIRSRASALALARKFGVNAHLIVCELEEKETLKRLSERAFNRGSLSDAGPAEYETLKRSYEPPTSDEGLPLVRIDTKRPIPEQIALISRWILAEGYTDRRAYRSIELE